MRLIDSILGREPERAVQSAMVLSETYKSVARERVGDNFISWATDGVGGNPIVAAVMNARLNLFTEAQRAEANRTRATAMGELIRAGYTPDSVTNAVNADDFSLLSHTGAIPTALYPNGQVPA